MDFKIYWWMVNELDLKGSELMVYALIHSYCEKGNGIECTQKEIAEAIGLTRSNANITINKLVKKGLLSKEVSYKNGSVVLYRYKTLIKN